ncbi:MAG: extracellular solute-binding protein [Alteromonadales bacterium]|nr:extracellular solute-binding protein [Alteromonadales bacterium]
MLNDGTIDAIYKRYQSELPTQQYFTNKNQSSTIRLIHYWSGAMQSGMDEIAQRFNSTQLLDQLKMIAMEHEPFKQAIKLMLFGNNRADIYSNWADARTQFLVDTGNLVVLDDVWQQAKLEKRFSKVVVQACTYNQKKYAIPVTQHLAVFFYNKHIFKKYGFKPPRTWAEFMNLGDKLINKGITPVALGSKDRWPSQFWFDYLLLRTAGPEYREALMRGKASYTNKQVKEVFILWKQLIDKGFFNEQPNQVTWTQAAKQVHEERAAMTLMGTWLIRYFESELKWQENSDYGFFFFLD